ncbi:MULTISPECIES: hypothetical protein [Staphylococcus]|uniref:Uncharacterized protein n=1 Tax=Staphylococcus agnetis TaxID=985762 RepID=A0AAW9Z0T5_9STAP|nr:MULTISPECIES: hypothetical protein [Staphylococcus]NHM92953.1 hypothetical protein [Staphylococcus sp. 10602379]NJI03706.1 hypothetical protein [Staphylococcus agnetis]
MKEVETKFIIEVNEGVYLLIERIHGSFTFTNKPQHATSFDEKTNNAKHYTQLCGGKLKRYTTTHEVE